MTIKAILFDLIGTTVMEKDPSMINHCIEKAFQGNTISVPVDLIKAHRGKDKSEMIHIILKQLNYPSSLHNPILTAFKIQLGNNLHNFSENEGARETIMYMKQRKIKIGIGTGLPRNIFERIYGYFNWGAIQFDYIGITEEIGRGRPHPDMIYDMMNKCSISHPAFLKVGDTVADIQEGKNAKVLTAAILSGTQHERNLINQHPDFIIRSLTELTGIVE